MTFDFTRFMQRAHKRRNTHPMRRKSVDGLLSKVMKVNQGAWVEVHQIRYEAMYHRLMEKAEWIQSRKKRRLIASESSEDDDTPRLP